MKYPQELKDDIKNRMKNGEKVSDLNKEFGISSKTLYKWKKEIENQVNFDKDKKNPVVQSKLIKIAIKEENYEEAKKIGDRFKNNASIQSQIIKIEMERENYEEAKKIGKRFEDNASIQSQMIKIALKEGDYERIKKIGERFTDYEPIQSQIKSIGLLENKIDKKKRILNQIKTKIYFDKINQEDIERIKNSTELSEYEKTCILFAIYEKQKNVEKAKKLNKEYKSKNGESKKEFNMIMQRIQSKKIMIFDFGYYDNLLGWSIDKTIANNYEKEIREEKAKKREKMNPKNTRN